MTVEAAAVSVAVTATALNAAQNTLAQNRQAVTLYNNGAQTVFLGPSTVTTATGFPLVAGASATWEPTDVGERLYGIVAATTCEVRVVRAGVVA